jgi:hypothetical protein
MSSIQAKNVNHPGYSENLKEEKYTLVREAILCSLPDEPGASMSFSELEAAVKMYMEDRDVPWSLFPKPGSVRWYTKTVQLDLEARGEIERLPARSPIRLRKVGAAR